MAGLKFNAATGKLSGLVAQCEDDFFNLRDIFSSSDSDADTNSADLKSCCTTKVLQTLWRDASSTFYVLGPYMEFNNEGASVNDLHCMIRSVVRQFHLINMQTSVIVADASPVNRRWFDECLKKGFSMSEFFKFDVSTPLPEAVNADEEFERLNDVRKSMLKELHMGCLLQ